jgi:hypothetical protein
MTINTSYTAGSITQTVRLNVSVLGSYSISTNAVAGIIFSKSGTFSYTGVQDVVLIASGIPTSSGTLTFTVNMTGSAGTATCTFVRYVKPESSTMSLSGIVSNGCNSGAQGANDLRTFGWQDTGSTFTLTGGNYSLSFSANIAAKGRVYSGSSSLSKPLEGKVLYRIRNISTSATFLETGGNRNTYSVCQTRTSSGEIAASGQYNGSVGITTIPAGTYILQAFGESYMGGCTNGGGDFWAGCGLSVEGGSLTIMGQ